MRIDRLKELVKLLRKVDKEVAAGEKSFDMGHWIHVSPAADASTETEVVVKGGKICAVPKIADGFCGTSACVLGYAALHEPFNKLGLSVRLEAPERLLRGESTGGTVIYKTSKAEETETYAGQKFFGLSGDQAADLFGGAFDTPADAADWIQSELIKPAQRKAAARAAK